MHNTDVVSGCKPTTAIWPVLKFGLAYELMTDFRSNGVKGSARSNRSNNTTEVSLGAKIVQKSRENGSTDNRASHLKRYVG